MMDQTRVGDIFDVRKVTEPVLIVGCGALGSAVALQLAKLGIQLILCDGDTIESHNVPNQALYGIEDVGKFKANVLADKLSDMTGVSNHSWPYMVEVHNVRNKYVIVCVDSMKSRKDIFQRIVDRDGFYLDGRIGARDFSIYAFNREQISHHKEYVDSLHDDSESVVDRAACGTIMSIGATASMCASIMVWSFMDAVMGRPFSNSVDGCISPLQTKTFSWKSYLLENEDDDPL
jgi:molybdopterin/thiamine biosynthesis adenylyltransferase